MGVTQHVVNRGLGLGGGYTRVSTLYTKPSCTVPQKKTKAMIYNFTDKYKFTTNSNLNDENLEVVK